MRIVIIARPVHRTIAYVNKIGYGRVAGMQILCALEFLARGQKITTVAISKCWNCLQHHRHSMMMTISIKYMSSIQMNISLQFISKSKILDSLFRTRSMFRDRIPMPPIAYTVIHNNHVDNAVSTQLQMNY